MRLLDVALACRWRLTEVDAFVTGEGQSAAAPTPTAPPLSWHRLDGPRKGGERTGCGAEASCRWERAPRTADKEATWSAPPLRGAC